MQKATISMLTREVCREPVRLYPECHKWVHSSFNAGYRRRMEREAKAKVVASVWGAEFIQFLAALAVFALVNLDEKV